MKCKICSQNTKQAFTATILNRYDIKYYQCHTCEFLQTEDPYWLEEAYSESINASDTGYIQRNVNLSKKLTILLTLFFDRNAKYVDYAGGYGVLVRMMRDIGFDFQWADKYTTNLFAKGFEYDPKDSFEGVTTFESFEHFVDPIGEIETMLRLSGNIIFSTELLPNPIPKPDDWWYYGRDHGQHISFYREKTFQFIAEKFNLYYLNSGGLHLLTSKQLSQTKVKIVKFSKFGLHRILQRKFKSRTRDDCFMMSNRK